MEPNFIQAKRTKVREFPDLVISWPKWRIDRTMTGRRQKAYLCSLASYGTSIVVQLAPFVIEFAFFFFFCCFIFIFRLSFSLSLSFSVCASPVARMIINRIINHFPLFTPSLPSKPETMSKNYEWICFCCCCSTNVPLVVMMIFEVNFSSETLCNPLVIHPI